MKQIQVVTIAALFAASSAGLAFAAERRAGGHDGASGVSASEDRMVRPDIGQTQSLVTERSDCDPLVPTECAFPFPNSFYLTEDASTVTGYRVDFGEETLPVDDRGRNVDPTEWNTLDGFSPIPPIMAHFPDVSLDGCAGHWDIDASLAEDSPTVLLNAITGERIPHFVELDESMDDDDQRAFMIWPAQSLDYGTPYIVAIRGLNDIYGVPLQPSNAFRALRDNEQSPDPDVENRREHFEEIFATLEEVGIARDELDLAWDFVTGSREGLTGRLLHMRDDAMARLGGAGPEFIITRVEEQPYEEIFRLIHGRMKVPLYLTTAAPTAESRLVIGEDGLPEFQGWTWVDFLINIPTSVGQEPSQEIILQYGHGLFGAKEEITYGWARDVMDQYRYVACAVDWWGMAEEDLVRVVKTMLTDISTFASVPDRLHQGVLNSLMLMEVMLGPISVHPAMLVNGQSVIDPEKRGYYGNSQGGIMGGVYMAMSNRVSRGVLGVGGAPYALMLPRSRDFEPYFEILKSRYSRPLDLMMLIGAFQMLWDRAEPAGYAQHITDDPLPNTIPHQLLFQIGVSDAQVPNLSSQVFARSAGVPLVDPYTYDIWGMDRIEPPLSSGYVEYDYGMPPVPVTNVPPEEENDTHEDVRRTLEAQLQHDHFLRTGEILNYCDGACFF